MVEAFIAAAARSPFAFRNGGLAGWHPVDLLAEVVTALLAGASPSAVDMAVGACTSPIGEAALNITHNAMLAAGFPEAIPAVTMEAGAAGAMAALDSAVAQVHRGRFDVVLVTAVDSATRVPAGATSGTAVGRPYGPAFHHRYEQEKGLLAPGMVLEAMAKRYGLTAAELVDYAEKSRLAVAPACMVKIGKRSVNGRLEPGFIDRDESRAGLREEPPLFAADGVITAGTMRSDGDGAVAVLICSERGARRLGVGNALTPVSPVTLTGVSPLEGTSGAVLARQAAQTAGLDLDQLTVIVSEDSAVTPLAAGRDLEVVINSPGGFLSRAQPAVAAGLAEIVDVINGGSVSPTLIVQAGAAWVATATVIGR